jgi:hypothetical protein
VYSIFNKLVKEKKIKHQQRPPFFVVNSNAHWHILPPTYRNVFFCFFFQYVCKNTNNVGWTNILSRL